MRIIQNKYKKVADFCYELFRIAEMPLYFSKFSNKLYSNFQKIFLLVYKQYRKFTFEELLNDLEDNITLKTYLGLNKLPHYTTFIHFAKKLPMKLVHELLVAFKKLVPKPKKVAINATGISLDNASAHYCKRTGLSFKKRPYMKTTFVVDIEQYFILLCKQRKKARHDTQDAKHSITKLAKHYKPKIFYADRGYDNNKIFKQCFEELKAYLLIFQKNQDVPKHRKKGAYRKMTCDVFDCGEYLQRNKIETLNSMFKRRFSSNVKDRLDKTQKISILFRVIAYNIDRLLQTGKQIILIFIKIMRVSY